MAVTKITPGLIDINSVPPSALSSRIITSDKIALSSVIAEHIPTRGIQTNHYALASVGSDVIQDRSILQRHISLTSGISGTYGSLSAVGSFVINDAGIIQSATNLAVLSGRFLGIDVFRQAGSSTWTRPRDVNWVQVFVTGGGGSAAYWPYGAGAGGTAIRYIYVGNLDSVIVTVGAGGRNVANGETGGTSSFGSFCSGLGGWQAYSANQNSIGGDGGLATGGDINIPGGGGGAGSGNGNGNAGAGGSSFWGGGTKARFTNTALVAAPGGGGATFYNTPGEASYAGPGANGIVVIYKYS